MLSLVRERQALAALATVAPRVVEGVASLPSVQRCATMAVAHAMLRAAADRWGSSVLRAPATVPAGDAALMVRGLATAHERLADQISSMEGRGMSDPGFAGVLRQLRATEVVMVTVGCGLSQAARKGARGAWRSLWSARRMAPEALREMRLYEEAYGTPSVPAFGGRSGFLGDAGMLRLASTLPPMFRRRRGRKVRTKR